MSKIQEVFAAGGRRLFASEKPVVDAFNDKYGRVLGGAISGQHFAERAKPVPAQKSAVRAVQVLVNGTVVTGSTHELAAALLAQTRTKRGATNSQRFVRSLAATVLGNDKGDRSPKTMSSKARSLKRQNQPAMVAKRLSAQKSK